MKLQRQIIILIYFLKVYGNVYFFNSVPKNERNNIFDIEKASIGYLINEDKGEHSLSSYSAINCGSFSKNDFKVKGDTLAISAGSNIGYRNWYYYVKREFPKERLN